MKNIFNLKIVVLQIFRNSKYNFDKMFKFQESFAKCKWEIMCMKNEQSCDNSEQRLEPLTSTLGSKSSYIGITTFFNIKFIKQKKF